MTADKSKAKRKPSSEALGHSGFSEAKVTYAAPRGRKKVKFGDVTVPAADVTDEQLKRSIVESQAALRRALPRLLRPGVPLRPRKGVPLYHLDDDDPDVIIRTLDGVVERGMFVDGAFKKTS